MIRKTLTTAKNTAGFFIAAANSFNPLAYSGLTQKSLAAVLAYFLYFLLLLTLTSFALITPKLAEETSMPKLEVTAKSPFETSLPISGTIFANTTANPAKARQYDVILTKDGIQAKPALCMAQSEICRLLGIKARPIAGSSSILLLILPGILILSYALIAIKYAALAAAAALISYPILKLIKRDTSLLETAKIALYATTVPAMLEFALYLLNWQAAWPLPLAAYAAIVTAACALNNGQSRQVGMF